MGNEQKYSIMTVKDMLWKILRAWKPIAVCAVIGLIVGVLFGGKAYNSKMVSYNAYCDNLGYSPEEETKALKASDAEQKAYADSRAESWKKQLTGSQISAINDCMAIKKLMAETENYIENAIYMQVDPYNIDFLTIVYQIGSEKENLDAKVAPVYNTFVNGETFIDAVAEGLGWKNTGIIYSDLVTSQIISGTQLKLTFFCADEDTLAKAETVIKDVMQNKCKELCSKYGNHTLTVIESSKAKKADTDVAATKNSVMSKQQTYNTQIVNFGNTFKSELPQMNYYNYLTNIDDGGNGLVKAVVDEKAEVVSKPAENKLLFAAAGAFAGIIIAVIFVLCALLAGGKLLKSEELVTIFSLPYLGALTNSKTKFIVDRLIKSAECKCDGPYDKKIRCDLMAERIAGAAKSKGISEIVITGSEMGKGTKESAEALAARINELGVKVLAVANMMAEQNVTEQAFKSGCVFILETVGKSSYKNIEKEISLLNGCGVAILGAGCIE